MLIMLSSRKSYHNNISCILSFQCICLFVKVFEPGRNADHAQRVEVHSQSQFLCFAFLVCLSFCLFVKVFEPGRNADHAQRVEVHSQSYGCRSHSSSEIESVIKSYGCQIKLNQMAVVHTVHLESGKVLLVKSVTCFQPCLQ